MAMTVWRPGEDEADALVARAFGTGLGDLVVEFDRPLDGIVSALLKACLSRPDGSSFAGADILGWTIVKRRQGLLAIGVATHGPSRTVTAACDACGTALDLTLDLRDFRRDWRVAQVPFAHGTLRLPTPADLAAPDARALALALLVGPEPEDPDWIATAEAALSSADPLADLELQAACPDCEAAVAVPVVLETLLVADLARETSRLMDEIHVLAFAYHWTEPDILALPERRRRHYIARIQEAWAA